MPTLCSSSHFPNIILVPKSLRHQQNREIRHINDAKLSVLRWVSKESQVQRLKGAFRVFAQNSDSNVKQMPVHATGPTDVPSRKYGDGIEPFRGKPGSVSFYGVTHHLVEESKLVSSPSKNGASGSLLWVLAPVVLILSLVLPQLYVADFVETIFKDVVLAEFVTAISCETIFYIGFAIFILITDKVQRPYLEFSTKRWGLITGLKGHLITLFFVMGLKVVAPLVVTYVIWPIVGMQALLAITPLLVGYLAQLALELFVDKKDSSCWPVVPILFEIYRLYQLTRASHYIDGLLFMMNGAAITPQFSQRSSALLSMSVTFQVVGMGCLFSLLTFLIRLFPSRPVAEKY